MAAPFVPEEFIVPGLETKEFRLRTLTVNDVVKDYDAVSFAYTVVNPSESLVLGCVYINPTRKRGYEAVVYLWARQSELAGGLETRLFASVKQWIAKEWPFKKVAFPGRDIEWEVWRAIPGEDDDSGIA